MLAAAETALTRMSLPKAQALAETTGRRGAALLRLVEHQEWLNPLLLVVLASQSIQSLLLGLASSTTGSGSSSIGVLNITVFFVLAEVAPKTWAILHTERAALLVGADRSRRWPAFPPLRWISRGSDRPHQRDPPGQGPEGRARSSPRRSSSPSPTSPSRAR